MSGTRTVAEILAQAAAEDWPTSAFSVRPPERAAVDDAPTDRFSIVRPYVDQRSLVSQKPIPADTPPKPPCLCKPTLSEDGRTMGRQRNPNCKAH